MFLCSSQLGDFGLAKIANEEFSCSIECPGNLAYWAPEYAAYGKVSNKTDVYSFGVVLVELITGMRTTDKRLGGKGLVGWVRTSILFESIYMMQCNILMIVILICGCVYVGNLDIAVKC